MKKLSIWNALVSISLILALTLSYPISAYAQSNALFLENGVSVPLRLTEDFDFKNMTDNGLIPAVVDADVYSSDGTTVLVKAGTPATIGYNAESNGSWGKAGKVCITNATTNAIDNKQVSLRLNSCKTGGSKIGGVIVLSVLFFPIGLISGCMKGSMPKLAKGTIFNATTTQGISCQATIE